jgi:hypothetical protein
MCRVSDFRPTIVSDFQPTLTGGRCAHLSADKTGKGPDRSSLLSPSALKEAGQLLIRELADGGFSGDGYLDTKASSSEDQHHSLPEKATSPQRQGCDLQRYAPDLAFRVFPEAVQRGSGRFLDRCFVELPTAEPGQHLVLRFREMPVVQPPPAGILSGGPRPSPRIELYDPRICRTCSSLIDHLSSPYSELHRRCRRPCPKTYCQCGRPPMDPTEVPPRGGAGLRDQEPARLSDRQHSFVRGSPATQPQVSVDV